MPITQSLESHDASLDKWETERDELLQELEGYYEEFKEKYPTHLERMEQHMEFHDYHRLKKAGVCLLSEHPITEMDKKHGFIHLRLQSVMELSRATEYQQERVRYIIETLD